MLQTKPIDGQKRPSGSLKWSLVWEDAGGGCNVAYPVSFQLESVLANESKARQYAPAQATSYLGEMGCATMQLGGALLQSKVLGAALGTGPGDDAILKGSRAHCQ